MRKEDNDDKEEGGEGREGRGCQVADRLLIGNDHACIEYTAFRICNSVILLSLSSARGRASVLHKKDKHVEPAWTFSSRWYERHKTWYCLSSGYQ